MVSTKDGVTAVDGTFEELLNDVIQVISSVALTLDVTPGDVMEAVQAWYELTEATEGPLGWMKGFEDGEEDIQEKCSREALVGGVQERIRRRRSNRSTS